MRKLKAFWRFTRPHTFIATTLQVTGLFVLAGGLVVDGASMWGLLLLTLLSTLAANIYIVGLNQLADVEVDRLNKPWLPLVRGDLSMAEGRVIVTMSGLLALAVAIASGPLLLITVGLSIFIGTIYSLPPLHLKERPFWAALCIATVRGFVANIGLYLHMSGQLLPGRPVPWSFILGVAAFFFGFGLVIALYKDIPDLSGDRQFGIRTFTVRLGPLFVFRAGRWLLSGLYGALVVAGFAILPPAASFSLLFTHALLILLFWSTSRGVNPASGPSMSRFYMVLWAMFYAEYLLLGLHAYLSGSAIFS